MDDEGYNEDERKVTSAWSNWSEDQRAEFAFRLLLTVSPSTLAGVAKRLSPLLQRDFISMLPDELSTIILSYVDAPTLGKCARVSKKWKQVAEENSVWRVIYKRKGWYINEQMLLDSLDWNQQSNTFEILMPQQGGFWSDPSQNGLTVENHTTFSKAKNAAVASVYESAGPSFSREISMSATLSSQPTHPHLLSNTTADSIDDTMSEEIDDANIVSPDGVVTSSMEELATGVKLIKTKDAVVNILSKDQDAQCQLLNWKRIYKSRNLLDACWAQGRFTTRDLIAHPEAIYCLQFDEDKIISGSRDHTMRVWDIKTGTLRMSLSGHLASVLCLQYDQNLIISGSSDASIIIWSATDGRMIRKLVGHRDSVLNLRFDSQYIVSCSKDKTIRIWDIATGKLLSSLTGHRAAVNAVQFLNGIIVSASGDRFIKVWNMEKGGEAVRTLAGHTRGVACLQFDGNIIVSGSSDKTIRIWDVHTGALLNTLVGHTDLVRTLQFDDRRIISGSYDQTIKVWDIKTGALLLDLRNGGHVNRVFKLQFNESKIVSCSQDQRIIIWDFTNGLDVRPFLSTS